MRQIAFGVWLAVFSLPSISVASSARCDQASTYLKTPANIDYEKFDTIHDFLDTNFPSFGEWTNHYTTAIDTGNFPKLLKDIEHQIMNPSPEAKAGASPKILEFLNGLQDLRARYGHGKVRARLVGFLYAEAQRGGTFPSPGAIDRLRVDIINNSDLARGDRNADPGDDIKGNFARSRFFKTAENYGVRPLRGQDVNVFRRESPVRTETGP
jgi:hypothetical protein